MHADPFLIVVADGAAAQFYELPGPGKALRSADLPALAHESLPSRDLVSDRPGRSFESANAARHAVDPKSDAHDLEEQRFATTVAKALEAADAQRLVLVAAPTFLGQLRQALSPALRGRVHAELAKDLVHTPLAELPRHLAAVLPVG